MSRRSVADRQKHNRAYGSRHQKRRRALMAQHVDGAPCDWCGKSMFKNKEENFDRRALEADHEDAVADSGGYLLATRLLHGSCNGSRGKGDRLSPLELERQEKQYLQANARPGDSVFEW